MKSTGLGKLIKMRAKLCAFGPKMKNILKNFKKILRFFDQNLNGKLTVFTIFTKYFLEFCLLSKSIYPWKITPVFYNNFSYFNSIYNLITAYNIISAVHNEAHSSKHVEHIRTFQLPEKGQTYNTCSCVARIMVRREIPMQRGHHVLLLGVASGNPSDGDEL